VKQERESETSTTIAVLKRGHAWILEVVLR